MPKGKKQEKMKHKKEPNIDIACDTPSKNCKEFLVEFIARFYESQLSMALDSKYIRYGKKSISKFQLEMRENMMQALHVLGWIHEFKKHRYQKFFNNRVQDAL
jgi:hypothetical protein